MACPAAADPVRTRMKDRKIHMPKQRIGQDVDLGLLGRTQRAGNRLGRIDGIFTGNQCGVAPMPPVPTLEGINRVSRIMRR